MPLTATLPARDAGRGSTGDMLVPRAQAAQPSPASLDMALITSRAEFDALELEWNALFERAGQGIQVFQTFNWLWHWCNHFISSSSGPRLSIVSARSNGQLVLVWPLVAERSGFVTRLSWMGEPVSQYGDVVMDDNVGSLELLRHAWRFLVNETQADVVQLRKVRADAKVAPLLRELNLIETEPLVAPYLDLKSASSFDDYEKRYSNGARKNRRRQRRRLEDHGALSFVAHSGGPIARDLALTTIDLKRAWLKSRGLVSLALKDDRTAGFFADVAEASVRPAGCHMVALMLAGRPAALEIGVRAKDRTATHIIVYDPEFEKHSAGAVLMEDSIRHAYGAGLGVYDLLAPGDGYKQDWADNAIGVSTFVAPLTLRGSLFAKAYLDGRAGVKKLLNLLPLSLRRKLAG